jgi:TPR repeat protein
MVFGKKNPVGAWKIREITKLAESGDACMQFLVGGYYDPQPGVWVDVASPIDTQDHQTLMRQAAKWFRLAADQGHGFAQESLAGLYWSGAGVRQDYTEAAKWYRNAADQGLSCSQLQLGQMYQDSQGFTKNNVLAYMWMNLASTYELGIGTDCSRSAVTSRSAIAAKMTPGQINEAQRLTREWKRQLSADPIGHRTYTAEALRLSRPAMKWLAK